MKRSIFWRRARRSEGAVILLLAVMLSLLVVMVLARPSGAAPAASAAARQGRPLVKRAPAARTTPAARPARPTPTTLEEITIQGEIDVPQVLFITGRPRPLYDDGSYRQLTPTAEQMLKEVMLPSEISIAPPLAVSPVGKKEAVR